MSVEAFRDPQCSLQDLTFPGQVGTDIRYCDDADETRVEMIGEEIVGTPTSSEISFVNRDFGPKSGQRTVQSFKVEQFGGGAIWFGISGANEDFYYYYHSIPVNTGDIVTMIIDLENDNNTITWLLNGVQHHTRQNIGKIDYYMSVELEYREINTRSLRISTC